VEDAAGNTTILTRTVIVEDTTPPVITLNGDATIYHTIGKPYKDKGSTAFDNYDGDLTKDIIITNEVNDQEIGEYIVKYNVSDSSGNKAIEVIRTVIIQARTHNCLKYDCDETCNPCCRNKNICTKTKKTNDDRLREAINKAYKEKVERCKSYLDNILPMDFNGLNNNNDKKKVIKLYFKNNIGEKLINFYGKLQKSWYYEKNKKGYLSVKVNWENRDKIKIIKSTRFTNVKIKNKVLKYGTEFIPSETVIFLKLLNNNSKLKRIIDLYAKFKQDVMIYKNNLRRGIFSKSYLKEWLEDPLFN